VTDQSPLTSGLAAAALASAAAGPAPTLPPKPVVEPLGTIVGHPWEAAIRAGHTFSVELGRIDSAGRAWVITEIGVAKSSLPAFYLGLGCGVAAFGVGLLVCKAFGF
jgi:hypothetical protein